MGYPGDDGGPPDTRAGTPRRTAVWDDDPGPEWPARSLPGPAGIGRRPATVALRRPHQPAPRYPNGQYQPAATSAAAGRAPAARFARAGPRVAPPCPRARPEPGRRPPRASGADQPRGRHGARDRPRAGGAARPAASRRPAHEDAWRRPPPRAGGDETQGGTRQLRPVRQRLADRRIAVEFGRVPDGRARRPRPGPRLPAGPGCA